MISTDFEYTITGRSINYPGEERYTGTIVAKDEKEAALLAVVNEFGVRNKKLSPKQRLKGWIYMKDLNQQMKSWGEGSIFYLLNGDNEFFINVEST